jgi:hypothetical protein
MGHFVYVSVFGSIRVLIIARIIFVLVVLIADGLNSAIYFSGVHFKEDRIRNLGKKCRSTDDFENIVKQTKWIEHLKKHMKPITDLSQRHDINTLSWAENTTFDDHQLYHRIKQHVLSNRHRSLDDYCK